MEQLLHKITSTGIQNIDYAGAPTLIDRQHDHWLEVQVSSKSSAIAKLEEHQIDPRILALIEEPEISDKINIYSKTIVLNLAVSRSDADYSKDFLTILLKPGMLVTILNHENDLFRNIIEEINNNPYQVDIDIFYTIYCLLSQVLHQSTSKVKKARDMVDALSLQIDKDPDDLELEEILQAKHKVNQLANIVEDQHITLGLIPKLNWSNEVLAVESEINKISDKFRFLHHSVNRLEERIRTLQLHYQLILQEKGNKRLNTLTVIQAIFVPLTLIAGIYGMNFMIMPELNWANGYYLILSVMAIIAVAELWLFKKNGWFN